MILKNLLQKKEAKHTLSGYSLITCCLFNESKTNGVIAEEKLYGNVLQRLERSGNKNN